MDRPCEDCRQATADLAIRRRSLCHECFKKYVASKILKRMEGYRMKSQVGAHRRRLLLPLSGGVSSLVLLSVLDAQVKKQLNQQNRTAYDIVIGHVSLSDAGTPAEETWWEEIKSSFSMHEQLPQLHLDEVLELDQQLGQDLLLLGLQRQPGEAASAFIRRIFTSMSSVTARTDLRRILLQRLLVAVAKHHDCEGILFGHSDTKLAALALSEVAKGRGCALPNELADGPSPTGLAYIHPVRDLFKTELDTFLQCSDNISRLSLEEHPEAPAVSIRNTSIDSLLHTYITSQGEKYPSIMANVVRTADKLQAPDYSNTRRCRLCTMPITTSAEEVWLCYGCERTKQDVKP